MPALLLALMLVSGACSLTLAPIGVADKIPGFNRAVQVSVGGAGHPVEVTGLALYVFLSTWDRGIGHDVRVHTAIDEITVHWTPPGHVDEVTGDGRYDGLTTAPDEIWVAGGRDIDRSAFAHELVHVALWASTGDPDPDHASDDRWGDSWTAAHDDVVHETNRQVRSLLIGGL